MNICHQCEKLNLFITFICNSNWSKILEALKSEQIFSDCFDIIIRVFNEKLKTLFNDLIKHKILDVIFAHVYTIEFQKCSLFHAYILLILQLNHKISNVKKINKIISAQISNSAVDLKFHRIVISFMMYSLCNAHNSWAPCMKNEKCLKKYFKIFLKHIIWSDDNYSIYQWLNNERIFVILNEVKLDNWWVVSYNSYLFKWYNAHINVKICSSVRAFKYLYKYIYKKSDYMIVVLNSNNSKENENEIKKYVNIHYVSALKMI